MEGRDRLEAEIDRLVALALDLGRGREAAILCSLNGAIAEGSTGELADLAETFSRKRLAILRAHERN